MQKSLRYRRPLRTQVQIGNDPAGHALGNNNRFFNNYWFNRHILMAAAAGRCNGFDFIDDIHAFNHFAKHTVAPALAGGCAKIQKGVIFDVDKKLCRR